MPEQNITSGKTACTAARRATVLVVDDEESVRIDTCRLLMTFGMAVLLAKSTSDAVQIISSAAVDVALIDWRLAGHDDGMALGRLIQRDYGIPFVLFSGYLYHEATGHAYKLGATDVLEKPVRPDRLLTAIELAIERKSHPAASEEITIECGSDPVSRRWSGLVLKACRLQKDPNTEHSVAAASNISTSVYRKICAACVVSPFETRDLARFARALSRAREDGSMLRDHLAAADPKTLTRLFRRAGLVVDSGCVPLHDFFLHQEFISLTKACLRELAHLAANDPLFFADWTSDAGGHPTPTISRQLKTDS